MKLDLAQTTAGIPNRLTVLQRLGSGGFGTVYEVFDSVRGLPVALKLLQRAEPRALYQFKREFRALVDVAHPNLVALHELFAVGEGWGFTMELIRGVDFRSHVLGIDLEGASPPTTALPTSPERGREARASRSARKPPRRPVLSPLRVERARAALAQISSGLVALHSAGKLHCDLKPSNVLVASDGRAVVVDFGLIRELNLVALDSKNGWGGTPDYIAPEQAAGAAPTEASDWYSLGVMLFEALTGQVPFTGAGHDLIATKQSFEAPSPSLLVSDIPEELDHLCSAMLRLRPGERPSGREVQRILAGPIGSPAVRFPTSKDRDVFVGRKAELAALDQAFERVQRGQPARVTVTGESGVGKSALVRSFLDTVRARHPESIVLEGRCHAQEGIPYKALDGLIDALSRHLNHLRVEEAAAILASDRTLLARVFPVLGSVRCASGDEGATPDAPLADAAELRQRLMQAVRDVLRRLALRAPLILFIDDLQWGDADSDFILSGALRAPEAAPLLCLACKRGDGRDRTAVDSDLPLVGLTQSEAGLLAQTLLGTEGAPVDSDVRAIAAEAAGSPYLVHELVQAKLEHGSAFQGGRVEGLVRARIASLPAQARHYLEVVAVAGQPLQNRLARAAARVNVGEEQIATLLRARGMLRSSEIRQRPCVEIFHNRIRAAVMTTLSPEVLRARHAALAEAWEQSADASPDLLALHYEGAGVPEKAVEHALRAASEAENVLAFERAASWYRKALALRPTLEQSGARQSLAEALSNAGHVEEAAQEYLHCAAQASPPEAAQLEGLAAAQFLRGGHLEEGIGALSASLAPLGLALPRSDVGAAVSLWVHRVRAAFAKRKTLSDERAARLRTRADACWTAAHGLSTTEPLWAAVFHARQLTLARVLGDGYRIARGLALETWYSAFSGTAAAKQTAARAALARSAAERAGHPHAIALSLLTEGLSAFYEGRWKTALAQLAEADGLLARTCRGVIWERGLAQLFGGGGLYFTGALQQLARSTDRLLETAEARGNWQEATRLRLQRVHAIALPSDRPDEARELLNEVSRRWPRGVPRVPQWWGMIIEAEVDLYADEPQRALETLRRTWVGFRSSFLLRVQYIRIHSLYHRAQCVLAVARSLPFRNAERRALVREARGCARRLVREGAPWGRGWGGLVEAAARGASGDEPGARERLLEAEAILDGADMPLFAAAARAWRGRLEGGESGRALVSEAHRALSAEGILAPERMARTLTPF